jgi:hypothetical protein
MGHVMTKILARKLGRWTGKTLKGITGLLDDFLILAGCASILFGVYLIWSLAITAIIGGVMAIVLGVAIGLGAPDDRS